MKPDRVTGDNILPDNGEDVGIPLWNSIHSRVSPVIGIEKLKEFKSSEFFAEVFSKHSREEVEDCFGVGTETSTPDISAVDVSWPKPWIFMRMVFISLFLFLLFWVGWKVFCNAKLLPGLLMVGSFAIPISTLVLFLELNVRRNVSLYMVSKLTLLGGIVSLLLSLFLFSYVSDEYRWLGAMLAGPVEETGKVLAVVMIARVANYKYKLNGLLIGAAVGVGFAAFESMGYAMDDFTMQTVHDVAIMMSKQQSDILSILASAISSAADKMIGVIVVRGILSPFGHIVWSAISCCALWRTIGGQPFQWRMLCDEKFIRLFLVPVLLHMIWNSPLELPFFGKYMLVGIVGWFVCLSLVQEGLHEVAGEKADAMARYSGAESVEQSMAGNQEGDKQ
ncbi:MAG: PrsW family intramembrane metalloprotease [Kiritimatiellae bacterium]|nr:PrsW family intramembrane metalloprotease [Kiritimatiellia bacterium]